MTEDQIAIETSKAIISAFVKPVITSTYYGLKKFTNSAIDSFSDKFSSYLTLQVERYSCLSTIVFGHQKLIDDLYIPLTLIEKKIKPKNLESGVLINKLQNEIFPSEKRVLITDTAGMGKSTLSKFLFLECIKTHLAIPIFMELRQLNSTSNVISTFQKHLNETSVVEGDVKFTKGEIDRLFKNGGLFVFFDGYDEISFKDREVVTKDIKEFIEKYPKNNYIITSRPESGLLAFPNFKEYSIRPLKREESFELIKKYDNNGERSDQLISKLVGKDFLAVQDFLKNPLLTSLLYRCFDYKQNLPIKKHIFYRQVFDALFDWHDASKDGYNTREKKSNLDIDDFHRVLRVIGYISIAQGETEGDTDLVLGWIRKAKSICNTLNFSESNFLDDMVRAVPVFVKDGGFYRWSHKSLAEYFAAQFICTEGKTQQGKFLNGIMERDYLDRFSNVLDQLYDLDITGFRTHLVLPLSQKFSTYWNTSYQGLPPEINAASIRLRKETGFDKVLFSMPINETTSYSQNIDDTIKALGLTDLIKRRQSTRVLKNSSNPTMLVMLTAADSTILEILQSKKDPLTRRIETVELNIPKKGEFKFQNKSESYLFTDAADSICNQPIFFDGFTKLLLEYGIVIDSDKMISFESNFNDEKKLSELTLSLLND